MIADNCYDRHADFYQAERGNVIHRLRNLGALDLLDAVQPSGDFSDKPSNDLVIQRTRCRVRFHADFGAGRFSIWSIHGSFVMAPPKSHASIVIDDTHRVEMCSLDWDWLLAEDVDGVLPRDGDFGAIHSSIRSDALLNRLFDELWVTDCGCDALYQSSVVTAITQRLGAWASDARKPAKHRKERLSPFALRKCIAMLEDPAADSLSLSDISASVGLSPFHFCRAFKAATGLPPHRYRVAQRLKKARNLLEVGKYQIGDVALAVGYSDAALFSRLFKRETGFSPSDWQRERRR